jgi:hypothetical protein
MASRVLSFRRRRYERPGNQPSAPRRNKGMNDYERQERRARARMSASALIKAALISGLLVFVLPGGGPWTSTETGISVMGRILTEHLPTAIALQVVFSLVYGAAIAFAIYRLPLFFGILTGAAMAVPLFIFNVMLVPSMTSAPSNQVHVALAHVFFCLIFSAQYRAMAVPTVEELREHRHAHHHPR